MTAHDSSRSDPACPDCGMTSQVEPSRKEPGRWMCHGCARTFDAPRHLPMLSLLAVFPEALPSRCIMAGCPEGGTVLDPFMGSGTTALVARRLGRRSVGIELNPEYAALATRRLGQQSLLAEELA